MPLAGTAYRRAAGPADRMSTVQPYCRPYIRLIEFWPKKGTIGGPPFEPPDRPTVWSAVHCIIKVWPRKGYGKFLGFKGSL